MLCLIVGAYYLFDLKPLYAALLAAAPLLAWTGHLLPRRVAPWKRALVRLIAVLVPLAITLALAARDFQRASGTEDASDPYSSSSSGY
jgi:phosphoglycerol transferase MdoB-like AlkP superfamily enzyme